MIFTILFGTRLSDPSICAYVQCTVHKVGGRMNESRLKKKKLIPIKMAIIRFLSLAHSFMHIAKYLCIMHHASIACPLYLSLHLKWNCACVSLFFIQTYVQTRSHQSWTACSQITQLKTYLIKTNASKWNFQHWMCTLYTWRKITSNIECDTIESMKS